MKVAELRELDVDALKAKVGELEKTLFGLKFQHATGQLEDVSRLGKIKRTIARAKTVLSEKASR